MVYNGVIEISKSVADELEKILTVEPTCEEECFGEDETYRESFVFPNGYFMDIKCCGVQYEEDSVNTAWTESVLFDKRGCEVACSEVEENFVGKWEMEYNGDTYVVDVKVA